MVALPHELSELQRHGLVGDFVGELVAKHSAALEYAIHKPSKRGDQRNHHAHIMLTTRRVKGGGFGDKTREWDNRDKSKGVTGRETVKYWRWRWEVLVNKYLESAKSSSRIDRRSYRSRGIDRLPTVHLGPVATAIVRRGGKSARCDINTRRKRHNEIVSRLRGVAAINSKLSSESKTVGDKYNCIVCVDDDRMSKWQRYRNAYLSRKYHEYSSSSGLWRFWRITPSRGAVEFTNKSAGFLDLGVSLVAKRGGNVGVLASGMVELALAKGWRKITVSGSEQFTRAVFLVMARKGLQPEFSYGKQRDLWNSLIVGSFAERLNGSSEGHKGPRLH